jgi:hypothetical protein
VGTVFAVYLAVGFLIAIALFGWIAVSSVRRHGFRNAVRGAARAYVEELPMYWRLPVAGWMFVIALPVIAVWASVEGEWDPVGAVSVGLLWLLYLGCCDGTTARRLGFEARIAGKPSSDIPERWPSRVISRSISSPRSYGAHSG